MSHAQTTSSDEPATLKLGDICQQLQAHVSAMAELYAGEPA